MTQKTSIGEILLDIDDCTLNTGKDIPLKYHQALDKLFALTQQADQGLFPKIGICTGRDLRYAERALMDIGYPNSWSVIESGILIYNPAQKSEIENYGLTDAIKDIFEAISKNVIPEILKEYPRLYLYTGNKINIAIEKMPDYSMPIEELYEIIKKKMEAQIKNGFIVVHHSRIAVDISPAGIDKASGIRFLSKYTGIKIEEMLGVGDSRGDFPMLNLVGFVGCPNNASFECKELVKKRGGYISPFDLAPGVIDIIEHFIPEAREISNL